MEAGDKLKELNMTSDEMDRLTTAFKDAEFKRMLGDYVQELSDPENRKRYEEEIKLLEQERGNAVEFIHPKPFRALRTSVMGEQKCFINICSSEKVGKPECKWGVSEDGRRGQCWSLPHSLCPGRQDTDPKGKNIMIYDVVFHPDTLHLASKNVRFMDMVDSTAVQGIQGAFKVTLDKKNMREMSIKYKGAVQPCVIRKPIPGYTSEEPSGQPDPLAFPYPDEKRSTAPPHTKATQSPATKNSSDAKSASLQSQEANEPTKPNYTVKYRSFMDIQDFRCSRDSAQSPRPKEIVVTIDLPLLKAATDASLEVKERQLLLESKEPAYRLELLLAYPVDEDKGEARFNKQRGQLTVTLPVLPPKEAFDFSVGPAQTSVSDDERREENGEADREDKREEMERDVKKSEEEEEQRGAEECLSEQMGVEKVEEEGETGQEKGAEQMKEGQEGVEEEKLKEQGDEKEVNLQKRQQDEENQLVLITAEHSSSCSESTPKMKTSDIKEEAEKTRGSVRGNEEVEREAASLHHTSGEESPTPTAAGTQSQDDLTDCCISLESSKMPATDDKSSRGASGHGVTLPSEELAMDSVKEKSERIFRKPEHDVKPPPALLREIDKDGNEKVISDHFTSAGFIFQNSLMYELD